MARPAVAIPSTFARDWLALPTTGGATFLVHLPSGWFDPQLDRHPATEWSFKRAGWTGREGEGSRGRGEEFVLAGAVAAGAQKWTQWGSACRPAGAAAGRNAAREGAVIACWRARAERK